MAKKKTKKKPAAKPSKFLPLAEAIANDLMGAYRSDAIIDRLVQQDARGNFHGGWSHRAIIDRIIATCESAEKVAAAAKLVSAQ